MIGQSYFPENFSMLGNPIATEPLNPNSSNFGTSTGMQSLLQALEASTYEFEAAAYNPSINGTPQNGQGFLATSNDYQPQFPSYSPFGLNSDPYFSGSGLGSSGFGGLGETNPFFNAGFSGGLGGFFGGGEGAGGQQPGTWTETETIGQNGQPTNISYNFKAAPESCPPPPCGGNGCGSKPPTAQPVAVAIAVAPPQPTPQPQQSSNGCG